MVRNKRVVVLAIDSAVTFEQAGYSDNILTECKIFRVRSSFFAISGLVNDPPHGFSIPSLVAASLKNSKGLESALAAIEKSVKSALEPELAAMKNSNPPAFNSLVASPGRIISTVIIIGTEKTVPVERTRVFHFSGNDMAIDVTPFDCPGDDCKDGFDVLAMTGPAGTAFLRSHSRSELESWEPVTLAKYFVETDIDNKTPFVGPPIDVVEISGSRAHWVQKKTSCPAKPQPYLR